MSRTNIARTIIVCADDYAASPAVSAAILDLARSRRISALSCMTVSPHWPEHGKWLAEVKDHVDVGIHITLVDEMPLTAMPHMAPGGRFPDIRTVLLNSHLRRLDTAEIENEIKAQLDAFQSVTGFPPAHIDGHYHAHVFPGICERVLAVAEGRGLKPWFRGIHDNAGAILRRGIAVPKALLLSALGRRFAAMARARGHALNGGFSGVYALESPVADYGALFARFADSTAAKHVVMCHPAEGGGVPNGKTEYDFLRGPRCAEFLDRHNLRIGRYAEAGFR